MPIHDAIENFCNERKVDDALRKDLVSLKQNSCSMIEDIIIGLNPSANTLRAYLSLIIETARRDQLDPKVILERDEIRTILTQKISKKEKQKLLRQFFEQLRYPERSRLEKRVAEIKKIILNEYGFEIKVPQDLEGLRLEFRFSAQGMRDLETKKEKFGALINSEELNELYSILLGNFND